MVDADLNPQVVSQVREAADIIEVVSEHVRLRKQGRRWQGLCPFHDEKTASFSVDPERGLYYCFGCHAGGDVISFVMRLQSMAFPEAVERLARRFSVTLPARSPEARKRRSEAERARVVLDEAQHWFMTQLGGSSAARARSELERRGFSRSTWDDFGFGHAPDDWRQLLEHLTRRHTEGAVINSGLAVSPERGGRPYDRFRNRLTFPIRSGDGQLVAFGGRILGDGEPKYLNSPEGQLFHKRSTLFALDRARRAISDKGEALVVEGYFDCLSLHRVGLSQSVATLGTALTSDHGRLLRRLASKILLCYDGDAAGRRAAIAGARVLLAAGVEVAMVTMPTGQDPDDIVRRDGPEGFAKLMDQPTSLLDFIFREVPVDPAVRRRAGIKVAELVGEARDPVVRFSLLEELARRLDLPLDVVRERAVKARRPTPGPRPDGTQSSQSARSPRSAPSSGEQLLGHILLGCSCERRAEILSQIEPELIRDQRIRRLLEVAAELTRGPDDTTFARDLLGTCDDPGVTELVAELSNTNLPEVTDETIDSQIRVFRRLQAKERARRLQPLIAAAQKRGDSQELARLLAEKAQWGRNSAGI